MSLPRFSVIIPAFNAGLTIGRAIDSVLTQSYQPEEVIVVDDGSNDSTAAEVAKFGKHVKYTFRSNAGVSAARNIGARVAIGNWLAFLDADDWYYRDRLLWHASWLERDPALDFMTGDYEYRRPDGGLIGRSITITEAGVRLLKKADGGREVIMGADEMSLFVENHFGDTHTLSVPRKTFLRLEGYPIGRAVCEDVHFLIRLCAASNRVGVICEPMGAYVIHDRSATRSDPLRAQELTVETLDSLRNLLKDAPKEVRRGYQGRLRRAHLNLAYAAIKKDKPQKAMGAALASLVRNPGIMGLRDCASVALGCLRGPID